MSEKLTHFNVKHDGVIGARVPKKKRTNCVLVVFKGVDKKDVVRCGTRGWRDLILGGVQYSESRVSGDGLYWFYLKEATGLKEVNGVEILLKRDEFNVVFDSSKGHYGFGVIEFEVGSLCHNCRQQLLKM